MGIPEKAGYQYVCIRANGVLDSHSIIYDTLEEAVKIASEERIAMVNKLGPPDTYFIVGKYETYYWNGKKVPDHYAEEHYRLLENIEHGASQSYCMLWPMGYVFDRCPVKKSTAKYEAVVIQYTMDGYEPVCLGSSKAENINEARKMLEANVFEGLDDGPVFKAIICLLYTSDAADD